MNRKLLFMIFALSVGVLFGQSDWAIAVPKLLLNVNRGGIINIGVIDADGKSLRILTDDPKKSESSAVWSPNGRQIAFHTAKHIILMDANGTNVRNLTEPLKLIPAQYPSWSPDGKSLAFSVAEDPNLTTWNIYVVDLDGSNLKKLTHDAGKENLTPVWSPDGSKIAYISIKGLNSEIFVVDADGKNKKQLTKGSKDFFPTWSPDGKKIAYYRQFRLWVTDSDGNNQHPVPIQNAPLDLVNVDRPLWLPDGRILFKKLGKSSETYTVDEDGKNLTLLFDLKDVGDSVTVTSWFDPSLARPVSPAGKQATTWGWFKQNGR